MVNPSFYWGQIGTPRIVIGMLHKIPHQKWFTNQFSTRVSSSQVTHAEKSISSVRSGLDGANLRIAKQYVSRAPDRGTGKKQSVSSTVKRYGCVFLRVISLKQKRQASPPFWESPKNRHPPMDPIPNRPNACPAPMCQYWSLTNPRASSKRVTQSHLK